MIDKTASTAKSKVALVTGASGGIGGAVCADLQRADVVTVGLDLRAASNDAADSLTSHMLQCDVANENAVAGAISRVKDRFGRLDFIVHCAAQTHGGVVWKLPVSEWDRVQQANLRSAFLLLHYGIPLMRGSGDGGRIVLIGSVTGSQGRLGMSAYASSKAGLLGLAKSVARETARFNILVNVVEPGVTNTPMFAGMREDLRRAAIAETLLGKMAEPEDIASAVVFLCGPGGGHITGQIFRVDGGEYL
jgi:NAD(P)-dependent dehydrogenase (short-subunit alcohol dehydrogenase family)